jgi:hypothetical protein
LAKEEVMEMEIAEVEKDVWQPTVAEDEYLAPLYIYIYY